MLVNFSKEYHGALPKIRKALRAEIMKKCGWNSLETFYKRKEGKTKISILEYKMIKSIFMNYGIIVKSP